MPALSSFYTFLSGGTECTQNFVETSDYVLSGSSLFINLSSGKWANVDTVVTTVCALDLLDVRPFSNIVLKVSGSYQPYLSTGSFFYDTNLGTVSSRSWLGKTFPLYNAYFCYFGFSLSCIEVQIYAKSVEILRIVNNTSLTGINLYPGSSLSGTNYFHIEENNLLDISSLENVLSSLALQTLQTGGNLFLGTSANATSAIATAVDTLTGTKGWVYT